MSLESFFSAVGGALLLGEVMTPRGYLGCALIFLGTLLAQAPGQAAEVAATVNESAAGRFHSTSVRGLRRFAHLRRAVDVAVDVLHLYLDVLQ